MLGTAAVTGCAQPHTGSFDGAPSTGTGSSSRGAMAAQAAGMDMGGAVPMDMHSGYEAYEVPQPETLAMYQQGGAGGEHPAEQLQRLQEEAAQLAAQQSQVSPPATKFTCCCCLMQCHLSRAPSAVLFLFHTQVSPAKAQDVVPLVRFRQR